MSASEQPKPAMPEFAEFTVGLQMSVIPAEESLATSYDSSLRRVAEDHVRIDVPRRRGDLLQARPGDPLTLVVRVRGRAYLYSASVRGGVDRESEELLLELPIAMPQTERRGWYRVLTSLTAHSACFVDTEGRELARLMELRVLDLSG